MCATCGCGPTDHHHSHDHDLSRALNRIREKKLLRRTGYAA